MATSSAPTWACVGEHISAAGSCSLGVGHRLSTADAVDVGLSG
jgi:hypothetical protein